MIILSAPSDILRLATSASSALDVHASFVDTGANYFAPGRQNTAIASIATTTIVSAVGSSLVRALKALSINARGGANVVTLEYFDGTTAFRLISVSLAIGERLEYEDAAGWSVRAIDGSTVTLGSNLKTDVQTFTAIGANTWTKPAGAKTVSIYLQPSGGGGGSGRNGQSGVAANGGTHGGPATPKALLHFSAALLGATENVTLGARGIGGAAQGTFSTDGLPGTAGGTCSFGSLITAAGGVAGLGGRDGTNQVSGGSSVAGFHGPNALPAQTGQLGSNAGTAGIAPPASCTDLIPGLGSNGSGVTAAGVSANAHPSGGTGWGAGMAGGIAPGGAGNNGTTPLSLPAWAASGIGGSGGAGNPAGNGGAGGNGGNYGAPGGGGGATQSVAGVGVSSGKGGDAGMPFCIVITTL